MITIHIPKKRTSIDLTKEIMSATNIKNREIRQNTLTGLNKIKQYL